MSRELLQPSHSATLHHARLIAEEGQRFGGVTNDGLRFWLKPALGCLLVPAVGDRVLISLEGDEGYVLAVLERDQPQTAELRLEGDVHFNLRSGALNLQARDGVVLDAGPTLLVQAQQGLAVVQDAQVRATSLTTSGKRMDSHWQEQHTSAVYLREEAVRHEAEYGDCRRAIAGHEEVHAHSARHHVVRDWSLRGETLDLFAEISVALDGERVKLG